MRFSKLKKSGFVYFGEHLLAVVGIVLVWRGVWYVLDEVDSAFFGGDHFWTALAGIAIGFALLYFPDKDLKELKQH
jgi:hypothetical protein